MPDSKPAQELAQELAQHIAYLKDQTDVVDLIAKLNHTWYELGLVVAIEAKAKSTFEQSGKFYAERKDEQARALRNIAIELEAEAKAKRASYMSYWKPYAEAIMQQIEQLLAKSPS